MLPDEPHDPLAELHGLFAVIGQVHLDQEIRETHDAQSDPPVALGDGLDFRKRVAIHVQHIVEEAHGQPRRLAQSVEIDPRIQRRTGEKLAQIDGAERAGLIGQQRLLAAGIRRLDPADMRGGIAAVDGIQEHDTRLAGLPGRFHQPIEDLAGLEASHLLLGMRIDQRIVAVPFERPHERIREADGEIEVDQLLRVLLGGDEVENVRVVDAQYSHVRAAAGAALLDDLGRHVEDAHEGDGAGGHTAGGVDPIVPRAQAAERKAGAASRLMDERLLLDGVEDRFQRILDRQDKAGGQLLEVAPRVHERRRVGQKVQPGHHAEKGFGPTTDGFGRGPTVPALGLGDIVRDPPEHLIGRLNRFTPCVLLQIAAPQHRQRIRRQGEGGWGNGAHVGSETSSVVPLYAKRRTRTMRRARGIIASILHLENGFVRMVALSVMLAHEILS